MNQGFQAVADAIRGEESDDYYDNEKNPTNLRKKTPIDMSVYRH